MTIGQVFTPSPLANRVADALRKAEMAVALMGNTIIDPCCGRGDLLRPYLGRRNVIGFDIDPNVIYSVTDQYSEHLGVADLFDQPRPCGEGLSVVCNPPYVGRSKLSATIGDDRFKWLKKEYKTAKAGSADLAAYVMRHILQSWRPEISIWLITNSIFEGGSHRVAPYWAVRNGYTITSVSEPIQWPNDNASVMVHIATLINNRSLAECGLTYGYPEIGKAGVQCI